VYISNDGSNQKDLKKLGDETSEERKLFRQVPIQILNDDSCNLNETQSMQGLLPAIGLSKNVNNLEEIIEIDEDTPHNFAKKRRNGPSAAQTGNSLLKDKEMMSRDTTIKDGGIHYQQDTTLGPAGPGANIENNTDTMFLETLVKDPRKHENNKKKASVVSLESLTSHQVNDNRGEPIGSSNLYF
jgi:hypothetical protein